MFYNDLKLKVWKLLLMGEDEVDRAVPEVFEEIKKVLSEGETVSIPKFGTFYLSKRSAWETPGAFGRDETFKSGEIKTARFKPSKALLKCLNEKEIQIE